MLRTGKMVVLLLGILGFTAHMGFAGEKDANVKEWQEAAKRGELQLKLWPSKIQMSRSLSFDEDGNIKHNHDRLQIGVSGEVSNKFMFIGCDEIQIDTALMDDGEKININQSPHSNRRNNNEFYFYLHTDVPSAEGGRIKILEGSMKIKYSTGEAKKIKLGPMQKVENRALKIKGLNEPVVMRLKRQDEGENLRLEYPKSFHGRIETIELRDAQGREIRQRGHSGGSRGNDYHRTYQNVNMPDGGSVVLQVMDNMQTATVPFKLEDIPLKKEAVKQKPALTIEAERAENENGEEAEGVEVEVGD